MELTHEDLIENLNYDKQTGEFSWRRTAPGRRKRVGAIDAHGYLTIRLNYKTYKAHRLAWFYSYGKWPEFYIDHINRDRADNRIENLREVSPAENSQNLTLSIKNNSGYVGVSWSKIMGKWQASIKHKRKKHYLGYFDTPEEAAKEYERAKNHLHTYNSVRPQEVTVTNSSVKKTSTQFKYVYTYTQGGNTKYRIHLRHKDRTVTLGGYASAEEAHKDREELLVKLSNGKLTVEELKGRNRPEVDGQRLTNKEWAKKLKVDVSALYKQAKQSGITFQEVVQRRQPLWPRYTSKKYGQLGHYYQAIVRLENGTYMPFGRFSSEAEAHRAAIKAKEDVAEGVFDQTKIARRTKITIMGKSLWAYEWAKVLNVHPSSLSRAARESGWPVEEEVKDRVTTLFSLQDNLSDTLE